MTWCLDTQKPLPLECCNPSTTSPACYEQAYRQCYFKDMQTHSNHKLPHPVYIYLFYI
jgi:hypothetical protein